MNSTNLKRSDFGSTLILSPHVDDEVLGCFSFLDSDSTVLHFGLEERSNIPKSQRLEELKNAKESLGFKSKLLDHEVNNYQTVDLIQDIEREINELHPQTVLLPLPSYNQDHKAVYEAGIIALRPHDTNWLVPNVLAYEQPQTLVWDQPEGMEPNLFFPIDVDKKVGAYMMYESQVRGHRSPETLKAMAQIRGTQSGRPGAEGYFLKRMILT